MTDPVDPSCELPALLEETAACSASAAALTKPERLDILMDVVPAASHEPDGVLIGMDIDEVAAAVPDGVWSGKIWT